MARLGTYKKTELKLSAKSWVDDTSSMNPKVDLVQKDATGDMTY